MTRKILYALVIGSLIALAGTSSAAGVSPFTAIGNLEMEVLNSTNTLVSDINTEIIRIDTLNATQISEIDEQNLIQGILTTVQTNVGILQGNVTALDTRIANSDGNITILQGNVATVQTNISDLQSNLTNVKTTLAAVPVFAFTVLTDNNLTSCVNSTPPVDGWCPNGLSINSFKITDAAVSDSSFILAHVDGQTGTSFGCFVTNVDAGWFTVTCGSVIANSAELYYVIIE